MTATRPNPADDRRPILVLGLGNILLADDGVGAAMLERLSAIIGSHPDVELLDGGTQGLGLLPYVVGRRRLLILDAVALGADAATIHVVEDGRSVPGGNRGRTAHESNAAELLAAMELLGELPDSVAVVGIEPAELTTRMGLSRRVHQNVAAAAARAARVLGDMLESLDREALSCTS